MHATNSNAAYIIKRINEIWGDAPGKKTLQKIVFLIEQKGINLDYEYGLHFYGPYSGSLDAETAALSADGIVAFDYSGYSHRMRVNDGFDVSPAGLLPSQISGIDEIIARFKGWSPSELELLTTAIYAYNNLADKSENSVIQGVLKIKGEKYTPAQIKNALHLFPYFNKPVIA